MSNMSAKQAANTYKQTDQEYIMGIETPHGRLRFYTNDNYKHW